MTINAFERLPGAVRADGDLVKLARTKPAHLDIDGNAGRDAEIAAEGGPNGFQNALVRAMDGVTAKQLAATELPRRMLTDPDSVEPHDVTVAQAEASLSLNIARSVLDRIVRGWKEISNAR